MDQMTGFDSWWGQGILFPATSRLALGPTQNPIKWEPGILSPGIKHLGHGADHSPPSSTKVTKTWSYTSTTPYSFMAWLLIKHIIHLHGVALNQAQEHLYFTIILYMNQNNN
jgi:hypothetical protein